jgi:hypothetical protein
MVTKYVPRQMLIERKKPKKGPQKAFNRRARNVFTEPVK